MSSDPIPPRHAAELLFVEPSPRAFAEAAADLAARGRRVFRVCGPGPAAAEAVSALAAQLPDADIAAADTPETGPEAVAVLAGYDEAGLAEALHARIDDLDTAIVAPIGAGHSTRRPLYLISIPKAGTHLLFTLARVFGYGEAVVARGAPRGGNWYCVMESNTHTPARRFLIDEVARSPLGGRDHPFLVSPALFVYRDPRDILCSEADWFHKPANSPLAGYLAGRERDERVAKFTEDAWVLDTIRDRVGAFVPWLSFPNVVPVSYEELVGARGGGDAGVQERLVWSLQLKLQAGGRPADHAAKLYDPDSPTFSRGRIGGWRERLSAEQLAAFDALPQDFMREFGYPAAPGSVLPRRTDEFRARKLVRPPLDFADTPVGVEFDFFRANIVRFRGRHYAVPQSLGPVDLPTMPADELARLVCAPTADEAKSLWIATTNLRDVLDALRAATDGFAGPIRQLEYRAGAAEARATELSDENARLRERHERDHREYERLRTEAMEMEKLLLAEAARATRAEAEAATLRDARVLRIARRIGRLLGR
jgi:hypothetical protein